MDMNDIFKKHWTATDTRKKEVCSESTNDPLYKIESQALTISMIRKA